MDAEMKAYAEQVDLELLNDVIAFVGKSINTTAEQKEELWTRNIFRLQNQHHGSFQNKYGFLYLGEVLERYGERFELSAPSLRALALALAYTRNIWTEKMFVGSQRMDFIRSVERNCSNDIYLTGALYLLHERDNDAQIYERRLMEWEYTKTEELIFVMSLFQDMEQALMRFKSQLLQLLGAKRTLPVLENTGIYEKLVVAIFPLKKELKAKDMALLRALMALPTTYMQKESQPYNCLQGNGYSPLEISYANMMAVQNRWVSDGVRPHSLRAEKIVVDLFHAVFLHTAALPEGVYVQLTNLYKDYQDFSIKYLDTNKLPYALEHDGARIKCPETMVWFIQCEPMKHQAVRDFDVLDPQWDPLSRKLKPETYQQLFENSLGYEMSGAEIKDRIARFDELSQSSYLDTYRAKRYNSHFSLMVQKGVIDWWDGFQASLSAESTPASSNMLSYIGGYVRKVDTVEAFCFLKKFMPQYGYTGLKNFFESLYYGFEDQLWTKKSYTGKEVTLSIQRDYLKDDPDSELLLLQWADDYFFFEEPGFYLCFALAVLQDDFVRSLLPFEAQRKLFDMVISHSKIPLGVASELKQRYLTTEERAADQAAIAARKQAQEQEQRAKRIRYLQEQHQKISGNTFKAEQKFMTTYQYTDDKEISFRMVYEGLDETLKRMNYTLNADEAVYFLEVCVLLLRNRVIDFSEIQNYISKIKGGTESGSSCNTIS